jgi:hypothetical protein
VTEGRNDRKMHREKKDRRQRGRANYNGISPSILAVHGK